MDVAIAEGHCLSFYSSFIVYYYTLMLIGISWNLIQGKFQVLHLWMNNPIHQERLGMTTWNVALQKRPRGPGGQQADCEPAVYSCGKSGQQPNGLD